MQISEGVTRPSQSLHGLGGYNYIQHPPPSDNSLHHTQPHHFQRQFHKNIHLQLVHHSIIINNKTEKRNWLGSSHIYLIYILIIQQKNNLDGS